MDENANFLNALPRTPLFLPATWIMLAVGLWLVFFIVVSVGFQMDLVHHKRQLATMHTESQRELTLFQKKAKEFPQLALEMPLIRQLQESKQQVLEKKKIYDQFTHAMLRHRFSDDMRSLTHDLPKGLWITHIKINQNNNHISFMGYALKPVLVSLFLQKLLGSNNFKNIDFDLFTVKKETEEGVDYVTFEITNDQLTLLNEGDKPK